MDGVRVLFDRLCTYVISIYSYVYPSYETDICTYVGDTIEVSSILYFYFYDFEKSVKNEWYYSRKTVESILTIIYFISRD